MVLFSNSCREMYIALQCCHFL